MTKQEKLAVINGLTEQLNAYPHFYLADIEALNAEQTAALRRKCFEQKVKLMVVKNTLLCKVSHRAVPRAHVVGVDPRLERQGSAGKTGSSGMD